MKKRHLILLGAIILLIGVLSGITKWLLTLREPSYQGGQLSEWLEILVSDYQHPGAITAVRIIGTNALPYLMRDFSAYKPRPLLAGFYDEMDGIISDRFHLKQRRFTDDSLYDPSVRRFMQAERGFDVLGPAASNAIPFLRNLLGEPEPVGDCAGTALGRIGPLAFPVLLQALTNGSPKIRRHAVMGTIALGRLTTNIAPALPALLSIAKETNVFEGSYFRHPEIVVLGYVRGQAAEVVPVLTNLLADPNCWTRYAALHSLAQLSAEASPAIPAIIRALDDPVPMVRAHAKDALQSIAPDVAECYLNSAEKRGNARRIR